MRNLFILVLAGLLETCALALPSTNKTESITIAWDPNPATVSHGFVIYVGSASHTYNLTNVVVGYVTNYTIPWLERGEKTYFFACTSYNTNSGIREESAFSNEITHTTKPLQLPPTIRIQSTLQQACSPFGPWEDFLHFPDYLCEASEDTYFRVVLHTETVQ